MTSHVVPECGCSHGEGRLKEIPSCLSLPAVGRAGEKEQLRHVVESATSAYRRSLVRSCLWVSLPRSSSKKNRGPCFRADPRGNIGIVDSSGTPSARDEQHIQCVNGHEMPASRPDCPTCGAPSRQAVREQRASSFGGLVLGLVLAGAVTLVFLYTPPHPWKLILALIFLGSVGAVISGFYHLVFAGKIVQTRVRTSTQVAAAMKGNPARVSFDNLSLGVGDYFSISYGPDGSGSDVLEDDVWEVTELKKSPSPLVNRPIGWTAMNLRTGGSRTFGSRDVPTKVGAGVVMPGHVDFNPSEWEAGEQRAWPQMPDGTFFAFGTDLGGKPRVYIKLDDDHAQEVASMLVLPSDWFLRAELTRWNTLVGVKEKSSIFTVLNPQRKSQA